MNTISTKKASILIWSVFLLLFLSTSFLYISTKIGKYIDNSGELSDKENTRYEFLNGTIRVDDTTTGGEKYEYINNSISTGVLRYLESKTFTGVIGLAKLDFIIGGGTGTIYYSGISNTGFTNTGFAMNYTNTGNLTITNTGGFTNYTINLANTSYEISKEIGGKKFIKEKGEK